MVAFCVHLPRKPSFLEQVHTAQQPQVHKYTTSVVQEKCLLKVEDSRLFRLVELVRINLHFRTDEATALACWVNGCSGQQGICTQLSVQRDVT